MGRPLPKTTTQHLQAFGWLPGGNSAPLHLLRQTGTNSFIAQDPTGLTGTVTLAAAQNNPGDVVVLAYDAMGGSYAVLHATDTLLTVKAVNADIFPDGAQIHYSLTGTSTPDELWIDTDKTWNQQILSAPPMLDQGYAVATADTGEFFVVQNYETVSNCWIVDQNQNYTPLQTLPGAGNLDIFISKMNSSGSVTAGFAFNSSGKFTAVTWDTAGNATALPHPAGPEQHLFTGGCDASGNTVMAFGETQLVIYQAGAILYNIAAPNWVTNSNNFSYYSAFPSLDCTTVFASIYDGVSDTYSVGRWHAGTWTQLDSPLPGTLFAQGYADLTGERVLLWMDYNTWYQSDDGGISWQLWQMPFGNGWPYSMSDDGTTTGGAYDDYTNYFPWVQAWDNSAVRLPGIPGNTDTTLGEGNAISRNAIWIAGDGDDQFGNDVPIIWNLG